MVQVRLGHDDVSTSVIDGPKGAAGTEIGKIIEAQGLTGGDRSVSLAGVTLPRLTRNASRLMAGPVPLQADSATAKRLPPAALACAAQVNNKFGRK